MAVTISYQPWWVGCTDPQWAIPLNTDVGPDDLVESNVKLTSFWLVFSSKGTDTRGNGTFSIESNSPAEVLYQPDPSDVAAPFNGLLFVKALTNDTPARTLVWDPIPFLISAS